MWRLPALDDHPPRVSLINFFIGEKACGNKRGDKVFFLKSRRAIMG